MTKHLKLSGLKVKCFCGWYADIVIDEKGHLRFATHKFSSGPDLEMCMNSNKIYRTAEQFKGQVLKEIQEYAKDSDT